MHSDTFSQTRDDAPGCRDGAEGIVVKENPGAKFADGLNRLAAIYRRPENAEAKRPSIIFVAWEKAQLLSLVGLIGGTFTKHYDEWSLHLDSNSIPDLRITISRDKVCKKTVTWDCEPTLSPDDEKEVDAAAFGLPTLTDAEHAGLEYAADAAGEQL